MKKKYVTINDIAYAAGVSKTTVSFAFNSPGRISREMYEKIMRIAEDLKYVPNPVAKTLATRKTGSIGVLLPQSIEKAFANPYLAELLRGMGSVCIDYGSSITLVTPEQGDINKAVRHAAVDGFIAVGLEEYMSTFMILKARQIPFVCIDTFTEDNVPTVTSRDDSGASLMMKEVIDYGHTEIAVISLNPSKTFSATKNSVINDLRMKGFSTAAEKKGVNFQTFGAECSIDGGRNTAAQILTGKKSDIQVTAIVCMSDIVALGVYQYCTEHHLNIPDDVSVCGFDDIPAASLVTPGLTTIRQFIYKKGRNAGRMIFDILDIGENPERVYLEPELIRRGSLGRL